MTRIQLRIHLLLLLCLVLQHRAAGGYRFVLVPKTTDNPFFLLAQSGCNDQCRFLNCTCVYGGVAATDQDPNPDPDGSGQADYVRRLLLLEGDLAVDGIAISVKNADLIGRVIDDAVNVNKVPVITFDSDDSRPNSKRLCYVGTDNYFMGRTLAKAAKQITPTGGTFAVLSPDLSPNIRDRSQGFRDEMGDPQEEEQLWTETPGSPAIYHRDLGVAMEYLEMFAKQNPTIIVTTVGGVFFRVDYGDIYRRYIQNRSITIVSADDFGMQLEYLSKGYIHGLVGQIPYEMGTLAVQVLHELQHGNKTVPKILGTSLITHIHVPLVLPGLQVDANLIDELKIVGYTLLG